jgi:hypothetical protein
MFGLRRGMKRVIPTFIPPSTSSNRFSRTLGMTALGLEHNFVSN